VKFDGGVADIMWRHRDGAVVTWELENGGYVVNHNIAFASTGWEIRGTGDEDILWRHADGAVVTWEMSHLNFVRTHRFGTVGNDWQIRGTDEFDGL
jgi:hypothetical protein